MLDYVSKEAFHLLYVVLVVAVFHCSTQFAESGKEVCLKRKEVGTRPRRIKSFVGR